MAIDETSEIIIMVTLKKTEIDRFLLIFSFIFSFNSLGWVLISDFGSIPYSQSVLVWSDLMYYQGIAEDLSWESLRFLAGANVYPALAYFIFGDTIAYSILINSIFFSIGIYVLSRLSSKNLWTFIFINCPVIFYFSVGYNKEAPLIFLTSVMFASWCKERHSWAANISAIFIKPLYGLVFLLLSLYCVRKRIIFFTICLLFFSLFLSDVFEYLHSGAFYYYDSVGSFENVLRLNYFFISVVGYFIFFLKLLVEPFIGLAAAPSANTLVVVYFAIFFIGLLFLRASYLFTNFGLLAVFLVLCLSYNIIVHFRHFLPVLFVWSYYAFSVNSNYIALSKQKLVT